MARGHRPRLQPPSEVQPQLSLEYPVSGLRHDLSECSSIDIQCRVSGRGMIEKVLGIHPESQVLRLTNADTLLDIRVEIPSARSFDRAQTQRAYASRFRILKDDIAIRIRQRGVRTEWAE